MILTVRSIMTALLSNRRCPNTLMMIFFIILGSTESSAKTLHVGDNTGWTEFDILTAAAPDYVAWSSSKTISVGDELVFSYPEGFHNVYVLPAKIATDTCDFSHATKLDAEGVGLNVKWRAAKPGKYFFACNKVMDGIGTHCSMGQRLAITVVDSITTVPTAGATLPVAISIPSPALGPTPVAPPSPVVVTAPPPRTPTPPPPPPPPPPPTPAPAPAPAIEPAHDGPPPSISIAPIMSTPPAPPSPPETAPEPAASAPGPSAPSPSEGVHLTAKAAWTTMVLSTSAFVALSL